MSSKPLVTGYELRQVVTRHMSGTSTATMRVPHAIPPGLTLDDLPVTARCGATVQQIGSKPWPPAQRLDSSALPCPVCDAIEVV
ncbi:hypothetical protein [Geodermatophilus chilensis]|uniref:hypothetical protein n=1 Tax=Geodermatophilus chilensis TaxID=2035835 RepID=UPI001300159D|nr:hypothetical protein [Geodermatophilus chilensis]